MNDKTKTQKDESTEIEETGVKKRNLPKPGKKIFFVVLAGLLVLGALFAARKFLIVATVNNVPISRFEVIKRLEKSYGKTVAESLVLQEYVEQEAAKQGIVVTQEDIDKELKTIEDSVSAQGLTLEEAFKQENVTRKEVEEQIAVQKKLQMLLEKDIQISDEDVKSYVESNADQFSKELSEEEKTEQAREIIKSNQLNQKYQEWLAKVQSSPDIKYLIKY